MSVVAYGVDYAWNGPRASVLQSAGKTFACRYIGTNIDDGKMLTASELASLRAHGVDVVANVEGTAGGFRGYAAGQDWARRGVAWISNKGLPMPSGRPIYFSADWDVQPGDWPDLKAALDGAASVIGRDRVGLYSGLYAITKARDTGAAQWLWQTYGWSLRKQPDGTWKTVWADGTHIQQYQNGVRIDGADCDLNRAIQPDYGQWGYSDMNINDRVQNPVVDSREVVNFFTDFWDLRDPLVGYAPGAAHAKVDPNSPFGQILAAFKPGQLAAVPAALAKIAADVAALEKAVAQQAADITAIKQAIAGLAPDPNATAAALEKAVAQAVAAIAAKIAPTA